ncbi:hypothetical protein POX_e07035 [Penicillium oxalicum]|uniref:hypothetical protein n=1 Tax=Penicillium oxalicum TaxID=69781 RepID=UPI0020B83A20|nr:hypothetical protein POX_e07035 [Penicillium oxalicum]KAI2789009.1 hypothetical protein POX_e07035 [Penicillium oxalicum]
MVFEISQHENEVDVQQRPEKVKGSSQIPTDNPNGRASAAGPQTPVSRVFHACGQRPTPITWCLRPSPE